MFLLYDISKNQKNGGTLALFEKGAKKREKYLYNVVA